MYGGCLLCPLYPLLVFDHSVWGKKIGLPLCDRRSKLITGIYIDLPTSRAQIFSRARSATGRFLIFPAAKASERTRARLVSPAKNRIKWRHFGANHLCPSRIYRCVRVQFRAAGTGHEKRRAFRESSIYIETCILQTPRMDNFLNPILYVTRPLFFCNFLNEPVWKHLLDRLRKCHEDCARYSFKMQLPYGNYYTCSYEVTLTAVQNGLYQTSLFFDGFSQMCSLTWETPPRSSISLLHCILLRKGYDR